MLGEDMKKRNLGMAIALLAGLAIASSPSISAQAEGGKVSREDVFNNQDRNGAWSMTALAIEKGDVEEVKKIVPSKISRDQKRNFPGARSHNSRLYDIALFNLGESKRKQKDREFIEKQEEIVAYLNPDVSPAVWTDLSIAIEEGDLSEVKEIVPSIIAKDQRRNAPGLPSHNSRPYDIALFNLKRSIDKGWDKGFIEKQKGIVAYLKPESGNVATGEQIVPILHDKVLPKDIANLVQSFSSKWNVAFPANKSETDFAHLKNKEVRAIAVNETYLALGTATEELVLYNMIKKQRTVLKLNIPQPKVRPKSFYFGITSLAFSPTENKIAVASRHGYLVVIDLDDPEKRIENRLKTVRHIINFSRDGKYLICAGIYDKQSFAPRSQYFVLDSQSLDLKKELSHSGVDLQSILDEDKGQFAFTGALNHRESNEVDFKTVKTVSPSGRLWFIKPSNASASLEYEIYDTVTKTSTAIANADIQGDVKFSLDERRVAFIGSQNIPKNEIRPGAKYITIWDVSEHKKVAQIAVEDPSLGSSDYALSPDGLYLIVCVRNKETKGATIKMYDIAQLAKEQAGK